MKIVIPDRIIGRSKLGVGRKFQALLLGLLISFSVMAQEKAITGTVVGADGLGIPGVNVAIKGTTNGTITNIDGVFKLNANDGDVLMYSFIGYIQQEIVVGNQVSYDVVMQEDMTDLDEVVVVGYGVQKKSDVTGAISTVKPEELLKRDVANVDQALQGQIAGVTVTQASGTPGAAPSVRVRGIGTINNSEPLYVVDGMMVDDIAYLNARDIESLQVLKDASASAIYGSRGANGVIIVTTKKGKSGKGKVNLSAYYGFQNFAHTPELTTAAEWAMLNNEAQIAAGQTPNYNNPQALGKGTDWLGAISNDNAPIQNYDLSFSGGNEKSNYFISGSYLKQDGIVKKTDYERMSVRINSEHQVKEWLTVGENITVANSNQGTVLEGDEWNNLLITPLNMEPITPVYNEDGSYGASQNQVNNPVAAIDNTFDKNTNFRVIGNVYGNLTLFKGLTFKTNVGVQYGFGEGNSYNSIYEVSLTDKNGMNSLSKDHNKDLLLEWSNTLSYRTTFADDHDFSAVIGTSFDSRKYEWDGMTVTDFPNDFEENRIISNSRNVKTATVYGAFQEEIMISYLGRANYSYAGKYLLTANFRADASSKFGSNEKWGYFPSFSAGWRLTEEGFLQGADFISNLKLRAGWGQIGNAGSLNPYMQTTTATGSQDYVLGNKIVSGVAFQGVGNDDLKWETTTTTNLGLDFGFWRGKLSGSVEYYIKNTTDMLLDVPVPGQTGIVNPPFQNTGEMENSGLELALQWRNKIGEVGYSIGGNFTTINNEVTGLGGGDEIISTGDFRSSGFVCQTVVGRPIANFYGLVAEGLFQNQAEINEYYKGADGGVPGSIKPGDVRYKDVDGDGVPDHDFIGSPLPDFTYSINGSLDYKGIDFNFLLNGVYGNEVYNGPGYYQFNSSAYWNMGKEMLNRWTGEGSTNNPRHARMNAKDSNNTRLSSRYVEDGSYLRIQNVQIGYTLPQNITDKLKIDKLRVYVSGQNLYTFTEYTGYDPEVGGSGLEWGLDRAAYPIARTITFGVNLGF